MFKTADDVRRELKKCSSKKTAKALQWFFKTGPGEYGEGDRFIGVKVPNIRAAVKKHSGISTKETTKLLKSKIHEERLAALLLLVLKFQAEDGAEKKKIFDIYLKNTRYINNWDLIDLSAPRIVGGFLMDRSRKKLYSLAKSKVLWERRIAALATFYFIDNNQFSDSLKIAAMLLNDKEDLIHKAVGWMLREIGKRNLASEERFLKKHYKTMPRTMLRYAIERFPEAKRRRYLKRNGSRKGIFY
jgi:3-methyladenine DNA glycosylase AlkD